MKKSILILGFLLLQSALFSQSFDSDNVEKLEVVKEYRNELLKAKLELSDKELETFLPIYNEHQLALRTAKRSFRRKWYTKDVDNLNTEEAKEYFNDALALQQKEHDLLNEFGPKVAEVIGWSKTVKVKKVEREIKPLLLEKANALKIEKKRKSPRKSPAKAKSNTRKP